MLNALLPGTVVPIHRHPMSNENVVGLQVADLVAYPVTRHVMNPDGVNLAYDVLKGNIFTLDGKLYGMRVIP